MVRVTINYVNAHHAPEAEDVTCWTTVGVEVEETTDDGSGPLIAAVVEVEVPVDIRETGECGAAFARSSLTTCRTISNNCSKPKSDT